MSQFSSLTGLGPHTLEALSPYSYPKAEAQGIQGKWGGHKKGKPGSYGEQSQGWGPAGIAGLVRAVCQEWMKTLSVSGWGWGWGWGGLAAGDSPKTSIHLLFRLTQVCWSLAYLLTRFSRSLESLVYSYDYFYPICTVSTHKLPLSSGRLAMAGGRNCGVKPDLRRSEALSHRPPRKSQKSFQVSNPQRRHASEMEGKPSTEANKISNSHTPSCRNLDL